MKNPNHNKIYTSPPPTSIEITKLHVRNYALERRRATRRAVANGSSAITRPRDYFLEKIGDISNETKASLKRHEDKPDLI
jgi:hypothetical protein